MCGAVKQSKTIKKGAKLPLDTDAKLLMLNDNNEPQEVNIKELLQGKKVVIFGLPGMLLFNRTRFHRVGWGCDTGGGAIWW